jgi:hypothetical protein
MEIYVPAGHERFVNALSLTGVLRQTSLPPNGWTR